MRQMLQKLGIVGAGGNYKTTKHRIEKLGIDISHFKGQGWLKGKTHNNQPLTSLDKIFNGEHPLYNTNKLRKRLIKENIFQPCLF